MGGEKAGACISDPPYGIGFDTDYTRFTVQQHHNTNHGGSIKGDDKPFDPAPFLGYPSVVLWGANCFSQRLPVGSWLVWDKRFDNGEAWLADAEVAWMKSGHGVYIHKETTQGFVRSEKINHPTQKPVGVMMWCIQKSKAGGIIFDPFLGSGTTLIAAHRLGRVCYGCEIEPRYGDVILKRAEAEGLTCEKES
jgi:DNA modification methylase